jgi:hypothetical protein
LCVSIRGSHGYVLNNDDVLNLRHGLKPGNFTYDNKDDLRCNSVRVGWNNRRLNSVSLKGGPIRRPTMTKLESAEIHAPNRAVAKTPFTISQDDARQGPIGHQALYVLGFGLAGAILANMLVFIYFASFYASS